MAKHLPDGFSADIDAVTDDRSRSGSRDGAAKQESSLKLLGGDIHRDLYKINARSRLHQRSASFAGVSSRDRSYATSPDAVDERTPLTAGEAQAPGGMRREYLQRQHGRSRTTTAPVTSNFVSFLDLYGGFAGEDLFEPEDESEADSDPEDGRDGDVQEGGESGQRRPLLAHRKSSRASKPGEAGTAKTFFTLLKAFIGTGIMFLPKAFNNGGILFSSITLLTIAALSTVCFRLLLQCRKEYGGGYGELGAAIGGPKLRGLILASIAISQLGFVCAGTIFVAENLFSFLDAVTPAHTTPLSTSALIGLQAVVLVPLAFIRNISKLGPVAILADVFILAGLSYIYYFDIASLARRGLEPTVVLFNPAAYTLTIGSAIFTFEGIGLILPIQSSMKSPDHFEPLLYAIMALITLVFTSIGLLSYATFGAATATEIITNYPQDSPLVNAIQFLYSLAVLIGTPVQLFPAMRILEDKLFSRHASGKKSTAVQWKKNAFRTALVGLCIGVAILGASDLDKFVALTGSFACVPLVYIYPPFMHYRGVAKGWREKGGDVLMMGVGVAAMGYTSAVTAAQWAKG